MRRTLFLILFGLLLIGTVSAVPPVASFTTLTTQNTYPIFAINFTDTSSNTPTSWIWNYTNVSGNNTPFTFSTARHPAIYFDNGNWSITLTATNSDGSNTTPGTFFNVSDCSGSVCYRNFYAQYGARLNVLNQNKTWSDILAMDTSSAVADASTFQIGAGSTNGYYANNSRMGLTFTTTRISSSSTVTSATVSVYDVSRSSGLGTLQGILVSFSPSSEVYTTSDFNVTKWGSTALATNITLFPVTGWANFTVTNLGYINKSGNTTFGLRSQYDVNNASPTWASLQISYAQYRTYSYANLPYKPILTVGYTLSGGGASVTHYNTSYFIPTQSPSMGTDVVWIIFALLGIGFLVLSGLGGDVVADLSGVFASLFLFISTIQAFAVDTVTSGGTVFLTDAGLHEIVSMENHTIYHYDFMGVVLGLCFVIALANNYRLWLDYKRITEQEVVSQEN